MSEERKIKILCVEDEQEIRETIAEILRDEEFEVFEADNGRTGFESFLKNQPDLVISDIMMPDVDGYGMLQMIRESKSSGNNLVPFIFLTALGQKDDVIKGIDMSANDYLIKPVDFDLMIAKINAKINYNSEIQKVQSKKIKNLKDQVTVVLPSDLISYLNIITQMSSVLKQEPYGPFPHRRYLEDLDKIYITSLKIRSVIANALDESVIDNKLNANEEIFAICDFIEESISSLSDKFKSRIEFLRASGVEASVKFDKSVLLDAFGKILVGFFKSDDKCSVSITMMTDHLDQLVIIFYLNSKTKNINLKTNIDEAQVSKNLDKQNCRFEIVDAKENTAILVIPSYRIVKSGLG